MCKKILSLLLVVAICLSFCCMPVFADLDIVNSLIQNGVFFSAGTANSALSNVVIEVDSTKTGVYRVPYKNGFYYTLEIINVMNDVCSYSAGLQYKNVSGEYKWFYQSGAKHKIFSSFKFGGVIVVSGDNVQFLWDVYEVSAKYWSGYYGSLAAPFNLPVDYNPAPLPTEHSTAAFEIVNTVPNVNVKLTNNGNLSKGSTTLLVGVSLNSPTFLESLIWKADIPTITSVRVGISDAGKVEITNIINALTGVSPMDIRWKSGRSYTLTLYASDGVTEFGGDGSEMYPLDTVTFTVDGEMQAAPDIPVGETTYSPTPPQSPSTGDVNVIVNESGNITGVQQWDGNQWIIIEKIEINNNGGGSGGTDPDNPGGGTDPDNPGGGEDKPGILDWLWNGIGKILGGIVDAISKILDAVFGRLVDLIVNLLQQIADAVVRVFDLLFTVLDRVLGAMTGGFTDFLKEFFYFLPPELVDGLTLTVIFGIILAIVRFFKGG